MCFSYNWPAQTNGVDYSDADEVTKISYMPSYGQRGEVLNFNFVIPCFVTGPFSPQVFIHHLTAETDDKMERRRQKQCRVC